VVKKTSRLRRPGPALGRSATKKNDKPYIIIRDNEEETCILMVVGISGDRNVIKKEAEKILNIKTLLYRYSAW